MPFDEALFQDELIGAILTEGPGAARDRWLTLALQQGASAVALFPEEQGHQRGERVLLCGEWPAHLATRVEEFDRTRPDPSTISTAGDQDPRFHLLPLTPTAFDAWEGGACAFLCSTPAAARSLERSVAYLSSLLELVHRSRLEMRTVIHDVNGLIAAVAGYAFILRRHEDRVVAEAAERIARELERAGSVMREAIALRPGFDETCDVDLDVLLRNACELFGARCQLAGIEIVHTPSTLRLTGLGPTTVRRCLENLLRNAITAVESSGGGTVHVHACVEDEGFQLRVDDDGPGIPADLVPLVTEVGFTTRGQNHQGLGLAYVSRVVDRHGGRLSIQSTDSGTRVSMHLPSSMVHESASRPMGSRSSLETSLDK